MGTRLHNYKEVREYLEKERPDWLRVLTPRHINAPADYWLQKVLAVSSANAAMQNYVSIHEQQTRPNPALIAVHGQAALLLPYDVPAYYLSTVLSQTRKLGRQVNPSLAAGVGSLFGCGAQGATLRRCAGSQRCDQRVEAIPSRGASIRHDQPRHRLA